MDVMLVDDDTLMRRLLTRLLKLSGVSAVREASDGDEALAALVHFRPELILTDLHMPRMDGVDFVRALRARGDTTPVIMFSGHAEPHEVHLARRAGINDYMAKPINAEVLLAKIGQTVSLNGESVQVPRVA